MPVLSNAQIENRLTNLTGWYHGYGYLYTSFEFEDFKEAFFAMTRIAFEAERLGHHPTWRNAYNTLDVYLRTHDAGGITEKDFTLARTIDDLFG
ncbi:MAG: 4a-hydroxytetrahydrobiopterin dehydratase [Marinirhabdus sp.]